MNPSKKGTIQRLREFAKPCKGLLASSVALAALACLLRHHTLCCSITNHFKSYERADSAWPDYASRIACPFGLFSLFMAEHLFNHSFPSRGVYHTCPYPKSHHGKARSYADGDN